MKIGIVVPSVPGYSETFFNSKIKGLQESGFEVVLFSKSKTRKKHQNCKTVFAPDFSISPTLIFDLLSILINCIFYFKQAKKLFQLNRQEGLSAKKALKNIAINSYFLPYQLRWLHFGFGTMVINSENVAEAIGAKMGVSFRGFDFYIYPVKFPDCYKSLFSKNVSYHVLSNEMKNKLIEYGIPSISIYKITPAIDIDFFTSIGIARQTNSVSQFITVGRLHWIKGLDYSLEAFAHLKKQNFSFHYTIIGDGVEKEKLMFAVQQLGLSENVTFVSKIAHNQVKRYMEKSNYYIQYSIQEGFCNAVLEAQAMGLLCIVSDADGLRENVLHEKTGWVIPKRNPFLLSEKISDLFKLSDESKQEIRKNAVERVKKEFNLEKQKKAFYDFYSH